MDEATMIQRANLQSVPEAFDRAAVERRFSAVASAYARLSDLAESYPQPQHGLQLAADPESGLIRGAER